jgi:hypothetical protein
MTTNTLRHSAVAALCAVLMTGACAADPADPGWHDKGFSYFIGLARQDLHYSQGDCIPPNVLKNASTLNSKQGQEWRLIHVFHPGGDSVLVRIAGFRLCGCC